ncbi:MAG: signal peptide peptidase SppA [Tepidisphaeraceae bacterium]|jgi:protease IV
MFARILGLISAFFMAISVAGAAPATKPVAKPVIAVFDLAGQMGETPVDESMAIFGPVGLSLRDVVTRIDKAAKDPDVKAVVVLADESAFGLAQATELRQAMQAVRAAGKDVYGHADGLAMGQYVLLSGASRVSVAPTGEIWAMGLYGDALYLHGLLLKLGIQPDFLHCGAYKSASEIFMRDGPSPEADQMTNWLLDSVYDTATKLIASGRNVSQDQAKSWIDGGPYTAEKAKDAGMIDAVEDRAALEAVLKEKYGKDAVFEKRYGAEKQPEINFSNPFAMMGVLAQLLNPPNAGAGKAAVGVVYVDGLIVTGKNDSGLVASEMAAGTDIARALDEAAADDSVKAVVLRIDSPGGSATASEIILRATQRVKAKKPLVVSMGDVAGSGGYYVSCAADTVFADDATLTASIGVVGGKLVTTEMWNKIGVTFKAYQRGANAGLLSSDTDFSPDERQRVQSWMDEIYGVFKNHVTAIRGNKLKKPIDELAAGRVFTGRQALDLGLVDRIGTLHDAIAFAADQASVKDYDVRTVPAPKNFLQKLMEQSSGGDADGGHVAMGADWLEKLAEPYLAGLDPEHVGMVRAALWQLDLVQREQVILMMPAPWCGRPAMLPVLCPGSRS